ncbi:MAG: tetratricopeptide repeat protein [Bacteroidetes bacterium]|nr:tetratricopeptide repeat protein [Bacteroidota bacterium]
MEESLESFFDGETLSLVGRFENMREQRQHYFFDVDEFEEIIDYYFFKNEQRKALMTIKLSLEQHPNNALLLIKMVQYQVNANRDHEALRILKELDQSPVCDSDLFLAKGNLYSQLEKPEKAIEEFKRALDGAEYIDEIYANIAFEYESLSKYHKAIEYLLKAIELNPENDSALYEFAFCCEISQQTDRCISFLHTFIDKNPYSAPGWFNLGIAFSNNELYEKAIDAYEYVLAIDESFSSAHFNKANCQANLGLYEKAIETYRETFFYEEPEPITFYYIGECYEKLKQFHQSIEFYQKAVALDPEFADAWLGIGISHDEMGKPQTALPFIQKAIKLTPGIPEYWFIQGDIQIKLSRIEDAIISYRKVIELNPDDDEIWLDLSVIYADSKDYQQGYEVLTEGLKYHEDNADFYFGMGYYLFMLGKPQQGSEMVIRGMSMDSEGHKNLFTTFPEACNHQEIVNIIALNKNPGFPGVQ